MILLWGLSGDDPLEEVMESLRRRRAPFVLLDQRDVLATEVCLEIDGSISGVVRAPSGAINLEEVAAVYLRMYDVRELPDVKRLDDGNPLREHALAVEGALYSWVEATDALVVNRPSAMASNNSKPYQSLIIGSCGFDVPATLVTTDAEAAREFLQLHGEVVYKSISSVRSIVSRISTGHLERLKDLAWCPTQFQQYVSGTDYRVHVVGDELLVCEIISGADDYRYARRQGSSVALRRAVLPTQICARVKELVNRLGLSLAGVDLRLTPEGRWYCFEVNPSPGFTFFQEDEEHLIAEAIADLLLLRARQMP